MKILLIVSIFLSFTVQSQKLKVTADAPKLKVTAGAPKLRVSANISIDNSVYVLTLAPNLERRTASVTGNQVTISRTATNADVGKIVALKNTQYVPGQQEAKITWNGIVVSVSGGKLIVSGGDGTGSLHDTSSVECLIGTNFWDSLNNAHNTAIALGKKKVFYNWNGEIWCVPTLSATFLANNSLTLNVLRGFKLDGTDTLEIYGRDSSQTKIKYGSEDRIDLYSVDGRSQPPIYVYCYSTGLYLHDLTYTCPDRASVMNVTALNFAQGYEGARGIHLNRVNIVSPNIDFGWENIINEDNSWGSPGTGFNHKRLEVRVENSHLQGGTPITEYNQSGVPLTGDQASNKRLYVNNVHFTGGGKRKFFLPYKDCLKAAIAGGISTVTVNNPNASFKNSHSYQVEWDGRPMCFVYPPAEDTLTIIYHAPGVNGHSIYGHGEYELSYINATLRDGAEHWIYLQWDAATNPNTNSYTYQSGQSNVLARLYYPYSNLTEAYGEEIGGFLAFDEITRLMATGVPVRVKFVSGQLHFMEAVRVYTTNIGTNTATVSKDYEGTQPLDAALVTKLNGGSIMIVGRGSSNPAGEGHLFYIHRNTSIFANNVFCNMDGIKAQYGEYAFRHGSDTGVPGQSDEITITNWYGTATPLPWFYSQRILKPTVQLTNDNTYGYLSFPGTATLGESIYIFDPTQSLTGVSRTVVTGE